MCNPGIEATSLITRMLAIYNVLKFNSIGKNLKGTIFVKVFETPFVYTVKVSADLQSKTFSIISLILHILEV